MPIHPLPQFEADLKALQEEDRKVYESLKAPKTVVARFGAMKYIGEFAYDGTAKPGCGSKLVVRTFRGTEMGEMLTSTCPNSGCSKSVSRQEMLKYIDNSGGKDYPFFAEGRVLRIASPEDLRRQEELEQSRHGLKVEARRVAEPFGMPLKIVDAEPILGGERLTVYYNSEERLDLHELMPALARALHARVDMKQVGARDEARLTADYERCGQYCCCKNFLKVLKPVSMKSAKVQKATLDPLKISGRCGRLMCCLRYEDQTYEDLSRRLPRKKARVGTPEGDGTVIDSQILTQLVLVRLDAPNPDGTPKDIAIAVEELSEPGSTSAPVRAAPAGPPSGGGGASRGPDSRGPEPRGPQGARPESPRPESPRPDAPRESREQRAPREDRPRDDRGPAPRQPQARPDQPRPPATPRGADRAPDRAPGPPAPRPRPRRDDDDFDIDAFLNDIPVDDGRGPRGPRDGGGPPRRGPGRGPGRGQDRAPRPPGPPPAQGG